MSQGLILGINGSPHRNGVGAGLLGQALDRCLKEGFSTQLIHLCDQTEMRFYHGEYTAETPPGAEQLFQSLSEADGLILSTSTWWFNVSGLMKNFIEHLTVFSFRGEYGYALCGKVAGFIATCEEDGGQAAINAMVSPLVHMGFLVPPQSMLIYNINMAEKSHDQWMLKDAPLIGLNVCRLVRLAKGQKWGYE